MNLDHRNLGRSSLSITTVGFGSWALGGGGWSFSWGPQNDGDSIAAIYHAVSRGLNWIDTAPVYGLGHAEEVVGRALRQIPAAERPLVFTKGGLVWDPDRPMEPARRISEPRSLRRGLEDSLRRLRAATIDLYQLHWPDEVGTPPEDTWGEMVRFVDEGKVRAIGVSNHSVDLLERIEKVRHVDSVQPPFSLLVRGAGTDVIPWAAAHDSGVIVYSPMGSGILTESFSREHLAAIVEDDWRTREPRFLEPALTANIALRDALRPIAAGHKKTVEAVAVAWTLSWPGVNRRDRGRAQPEADRRLATRRQPVPDGGGSGRDRRCRRFDGSRRGAGETRSRPLNYGRGRVRRAGW